MPNPQNKITFTPEQHQFLKERYRSMTNQQLADALGLKLTRVRAELYKMGLKRMTLEYWNQEQITFLKENYKTIGDTEIAEIFEAKYHKKKGWTKKHIEKKRRYLKLKRTKEQLKFIKERNRQLGRFKICNEKMWQKRGVAPVGEKRIRFNQYNYMYVVIKTDEGFEHYHRWLWKQKKGRIPKGYNVRIMSEDRINYTIDDLLLLTNAEHAKMNSKKRTPKELKETQKLVKSINRKIITDEKRHRKH